MRTSFLGKVHFMPSKYDPETRAKAVRSVLEHREDYPSEWGAITAVSKRLGMNAETLRNGGNFRDRRRGFGDLWADKYSLEGSSLANAWEDYKAG
jgi:transposase-like protein